jgi:hypothetical protein
MKNKNAGRITILDIIELPDENLFRVVDFVKLTTNMPIG